MKMPPFTMVEVPDSEWEHLNRDDDKCEMMKVFRSDRFLVQVRAHGDCIRLSVNKVIYSKTPSGIVWQDGITWDELQEIKNQCGFANRWMCEYYPPYDEVINVANIRHLWLMSGSPANTLTTVDRVRTKEIE